MKSTRRIISMVLALALILGVCPQTALAAEETAPETAAAETIPETTEETVPETTAPETEETQAAKETAEPETTAPTEKAPAESVPEETWEVAATETAEAALTSTTAESGTCGDNLTWTLADGVLTISGVGSMTDYSSSSVVPWAGKRESITGVVIGDGITHIGSYAFYRFYGMKSFTIPDSVTSIGNGAFLNCLYVTDIRLPSSLTTIGERAFEGCRDLTSLSLPDAVTAIEQGAFKGCESLKSIHIPEGITKIPDDTFENCYALANIVLPGSITSIGASAFSYCRALTQLTIPESVDYIGASAFHWCTGLVSIDLPDGISTVSPGIFKCCSSLESIHISESATVIGYEAFYGCSSLTEIVLPESVTGIGEDAFYECTGLTGIVLPDSVTSISESAFRGCSSLTAVDLPQGITTINPYTFSGCSSLTSIVVPESVTYLGTYSFSSCTSLKSAFLPDTVTEIWRDAFSGCTSLTDIYFSGSLDAWNALSVSSYLNGVAVHTAYGAHGTCGDGLTWEIGANGTLTISGTGAMDNYTYGNCAPWNTEFKSDIRHVVIESGVTTIGDCAFPGCYHLETVSIPDSVVLIGESAFESCSALESLSLPDSVAVIAAKAFYFCSKLKTLQIPAGITEIEANTFQYCSALESIAIPQSVTTIGESAFRSCSSLTDITIPEGVTSIGNKAFQYCSALASITIAHTVTAIGLDPFTGCTVLTDIYFGGTQNAWDRLSVVYPEGVTVHCLGVETLDEILRNQWISQHMSYIFSDKYESDIISGYDSWMLYIFRDALNDGGVSTYELAKATSQLLNLDFELTSTEMYELIFANLLYSRSSLNAGYEAYSQNLTDATVQNIKRLVDGVNAMKSTIDVSQGALDSINQTYDVLKTLGTGSDNFQTTYKQLISLFQENISKADLLSTLKTDSVYTVLGIGLDMLYEKYESLEDVQRYLDNYIAYQTTSRQFKQALQVLGTTAITKYGTDEGFVDSNAFDELGFWDANINWEEFTDALNVFVTSLNTYEQEGAAAVAAYAVERKVEAGNAMAEKAGKDIVVFGLDFIAGQIPILNAIVVAKNVLNIGIVVTELLSNVDDRKYALDMMTKLYCISVLLDESIDACADLMDHDDYESTLLFDESVCIYSSTQLMAADYALKYTDLKLRNAIGDYYAYSLSDWTSERVLRQMQRDISIYTGYLQLLEGQRSEIQNIACHDSSLQYVPETGQISSDFLDARIFVVACPVSVTVDNTQGTQVAYLSDNGSEVAEGYEFYFRTIALEDGSGEHIKVAIVPEGYEITLEGTAEGEMNAFVTDFAEDTDSVSMYLEVPVQKGSSGTFVKSEEVPDTLDLTMGETAHTPYVSTILPGDLNLDGTVTEADAIYLVWHSLFPVQYPAGTDADLDGSGKADAADAVQLLWHTLFPDTYPLG